MTVVRTTHTAVSRLFRDLIFDVKYGNKASNPNYALLLIIIIITVVCLCKKSDESVTERGREGRKGRKQLTIGGEAWNTARISFVSEVTSSHDVSSH